ncbi:bifunctional glutamate N-acetyltransferase/amino-acid acetyltransferase ArgJ [Candidatus Collinsella stercoripullorum]|uniref:bifunctional glutamate N-acetyltransferase/amino-acid acetyltransferase ArgJ n=1 Tax=Candidatus Collinsella stercoripullorum TaxID=2838522 RepID=UPI001C3B3E39|nr:bifunctional glutamate N-acetyltransferase/amino-acid acetyltransferase ArgJ [Candidatus Collinsella stercoripullorum]HIZ99951.1 bifunctional glutamate N-acetyltransferase/amino-acid acetyltransferase ArgJ [Candidatus Collinsella stercoripullorum]
MNVDEFDTKIRAVPDGGVTSARGFSAAGIHAGFRRNPERADFALLAAERPVSAAGVFTTNRFCAAPVTVCREHLGADSCGLVQAVAVNSGNANAATGEPGLAVARETCDIVSQMFGCEPEQVLVASTGVIGQQLDIAPFETGVPAAVEQLSPAGGAAAARAIMTTDTHPKEYAVSYESGVLEYVGCTFTVGGCVKGSGMIMPNMATMIALITTDAPVAPKTLHAVLADCVAQTFNKVTVDSDTSTNDTCIMLASGEAAPGEAPIEVGSEAYEELAYAVRVVCEGLARAVAADGEGASRLITVNVTGAPSDADADAAARSVANSPLVKTAVAGHDCNWGRIAMALGKCGVAFRQEDVSIDIMGIPVCRAGLTVPFDEDEALRRFEAPEIVISADLGAGEGAATVWTCDLTHDYVTINGDYRT